MKKLISIVIPAYNEEEVLEELKKRLQAVMEINNNYDFEVIIVENGSWDSSFEKLIKINQEDSRFKIVQLSRNFGSEGGITSGLRYAKGDAAVIMCADLQDPPEMITEFIKRWEEGYDVVYGIIEKRMGVSLFRRTLYSMFYKLINWLTHKTIPENVSEFRLVDKKVYSAVNKMGETNRFIRGLIVWTGFKQTGIPFERPPRFAGESKAGFFEALGVAMNGIISFSDLPLKLAAVAGFVVSIISLFLIVFELSLFLKYGQVVPGFTTLVIIILFLFGILFFLLGVLGVYVGRIYDEVKRRPHYIVRKEVGFT